VHACEGACACMCVCDMCIWSVGVHVCVIFICGVKKVPSVLMWDIGSSSDACTMCMCVYTCVCVCVCMCMCVCVRRCVRT
jgi:hypothetical protein